MPGTRITVSNPDWTTSSTIAGTVSTIRCQFRFATGPGQPTPASASPAASSVSFDIRTYLRIRASVGSSNTFRQAQVKRVVAGKHAKHCEQATLRRAIAAQLAVPRVDPGHVAGELALQEPDRVRALRADQSV
jgi:hypothetical protein